jgi:8-oxo-dGTP pyrophosphatase MutT (NUDIX family)
MYDPNKAHYVVATGIVVKDGKFLITRRGPNEKVFPNLWTVPGGKLEVEDYKNRPFDAEDFVWYNIFEDLVKREIIEEVGVRVKNIRYVTSLAYIRPDGIPTVVISLLVDHADGEIKLCNDLTEFAWVSLEEAKNYKLIGGIYEELEMADKVLKGEREIVWKKS